MTLSVREALRARLAEASDRQLVEELFAFVEERGQSHYDEDVTQVEHALQCAELARQRGLGDEAVTAALLHDVGHLLYDEHDAGDFPERDQNHEEIGADLLADYFPPTVTEPIRLHVAAKRYLCTTDPDYYAQMSAASQHSFHVQGGLLSPDEKREWERNPGLKRALELRRLDDLGKCPGKATPKLDDFFENVLRSLSRKRHQS